jgi:hypothetical protein
VKEYSPDPKRALRSTPCPGWHVDLRCRFEVAAQALVARTQDVHVQAVTPLSGPQRGQIGVRVGRVLVHVANREARASFVDAWTQAAALADETFGPGLPPPACQPRSAR